MRVTKYKLTCVREKGFNYDTKKKCLSPSDIADIARSLYKDNDIELKEKAWILALNTSNRLIGVNLISEGSLNQTIVHPREVFQFALLSNANSIVFVHNHPSGELRASPQDITISKQRKEAGKILNVQLLDSIIVTEEGYLSFLEEGHI
jgi:DNA repair protein RadC